MKREEIKNIAPKLTALKLKQAVFKLPDGALDSLEISVLAEHSETQLKLKYGNKNPFKTTANYFENFENSILDILDNKKNQSLKNTLKVPENYFENFEQKVLSKLQSTTIKRETKVISLHPKIIKISATIAVAASLAMVFIFNPFQKQSNELSFDSLVISEIENWIDQDYLELDAYHIASVYTETKLNSSLLSSKVNEDQLEEFLSNKNIEELLYDE